METFNGRPVLRITLEKDNHKVNKISLVDFPAMEDNYLSFARIDEEVEMWFKEETQHKLAGPFIIPDKRIPRKDKNGEIFYVVFEKAVIAELAERYNKGLYGNRWNTQHNEDVDGVFVVENWIIDDTKFDKSNKYGHDCPVGTWYGIVKVDNKELWTKEIESGNLRGFSIEMVSGLKMALSTAVNDQMFEEHVFSKLTDSLGETIPSNWKSIASMDLFDNEEDMTEDNILDLVIQSNAEAPSSLDVTRENVGSWRVRYMYDGPQDGKNRSFCARLLSFQGADKVFRREDINQMSFSTENSEFGTYSIFRYKGSYGCRHKWRRVIFFVDADDGDVRRVGAVPSVTSSINDAEARTINANLNKLYIMAENTNFAKIADMPLDKRVEGADVDDENGDVTVDGVVYTVADGKITAVKEEKTDDGPDPEDVSTEDLKKFMADVVEWMASVNSKMEELSGSGGSDNDDELSKMSKEDLKSLKALAPKMEEIHTLLKLLPAKDDKNDKNDEDEVPTLLSALEQVKNQLSKED